MSADLRVADLATYPCAAPGCENLVTYYHADYLLDCCSPACAEKVFAAGMHSVADRQMRMAMRHPRPAATRVLRR